MACCNFNGTVCKIIFQHLQLAVFGVFIKAKHTNGQILHRSNIFSALKYFAPSLHHPKACKYTGNHIPVSPKVQLKVCTLHLFLVI